MRLFKEGPLDQWEHELQKVSKSGLIDMIDRLLFRMICFGVPVDRDALLNRVKTAKEVGRYIDAHNSHLRLMTDITGEVEKRYRKSQAAKKAARRRKREARKKAA